MAWNGLIKGLKSSVVTSTFYLFYSYQPKNKNEKVRGNDANAIKLGEENIFPNWPKSYHSLLNQARKLRSCDKDTRETGNGKLGDRSMPPSAIFQHEVNKALIFLLLAKSLVLVKDIGSASSMQSNNY